MLKYIKYLYYNIIKVSYFIFKVVFTQFDNLKSDNLQNLLYSIFGDFQNATHGLNIINYIWPIQNK